MSVALTHCNSVVVVAIVVFVFLRSSLTNTKLCLFLLTLLCLNCRWSYSSCCPVLVTSLQSCNLLALFALTQQRGPEWDLNRDRERR